MTGKENVPADGVPTLIASNHFNCMNDAMAVLLSLTDRKPCFLVRADVFGLNAVANRFLRSIGLLPAFRIDFDGADSLSENKTTFRVSEQALHDGNTVTVFPQAGVAEGYWIDRFTPGMAQIVFEAASIGDFKDEILIVPACNYYRSVYGLRNDMLLRYGEPVKASEFYELYRTKPRTAARKLNAAIYDRIEPMMLDIRDKEHYDEIRFILESGYVPRHAASLGVDNSDIEGNLSTCKHIVESLQAEFEAEDRFVPHIISNRGQSASELKELAVEERARLMMAAGVSSTVPGRVEETFSLAASIKKDEESLGLEDAQFDSGHCGFVTALRISAALLLLPLAIFCIWPSAVSWLVPRHFVKKTGKRKFEGTFLIALNVIFIFPLAAILTLLVAGMAVGFLPALLWVLLFPAICLFEWYYSRLVRRVHLDIRWYCVGRKGLLKSIEDRRKDLFSRLDSILGR